MSVTLAQLEEQLDELGHTKDEMRQVHTEMAGLEDYLWRVCTTNQELELDLQRKTQDEQRQLRRAESLQVRVQALEESMEAHKQENANLSGHIALETQERQKWQERSFVQQQQLEILSRAHELLRSALRVHAV